MTAPTPDASTASVDAVVPGSTARTRVRRLPEKAVHDRQALYDVLDAGLVAHVALADDGQPYALPCAYARDGDTLLLHGSTGSRLFRRLADGDPVCVTVTLLDGLVYARSLFESSMQYRSAMVLGRAVPVPEEEKVAALLTLSARLLPGRVDEARGPSRKELAATLVVRLPLTETSVKAAAGPPDDAAEDLGRPVWAGVLPLRTVAGDPVDAPDLDPVRPVPDYVLDHPLRRAEAT
ncbi:MAG: pyridoxamine 5'-phosphate oxidase family protein [Candidatus Nanopelagicales bacterium]